MAEEAPVVAAPVVEEAPVVEVPQVDPKDQRINDLQEKLTRFEQMVVSPEYAEFLANKANANWSKPPPPKEYSAEEKRAFEERLNGMTRAEFAAFIRDLTLDTVQERSIKPIIDVIVTKEVQGQINQVSAKYADFWDYQKEMVSLANANPSLNAEQVYHLAKSMRTPEAPTVQKPPIRKPSGEAPAGTPAARVQAKPDKFSDAFDQAFKKAGL
jgi:hypothetical protein